MIYFYISFKYFKISNIAIYNIYYIFFKYINFISKISVSKNSQLKFKILKFQLYYIINIVKYLFVFFKKKKQFSSCTKLFRYLYLQNLHIAYPKPKLIDKSTICKLEEDL